MKQLDEAIRKTLSEEDAKILESLDSDQSLNGRVLDTLKGRSKWINACGWLLGFALFIVGCIFAWQFTNQIEPRETMLWGSGAALSFAGLMLIKVWFWLEMHKNAVVREIKRVELQVASLAARLDGQ